MSRKRGRSGVYVIRTRKPHAVVGLPIIGRHTGYVGETGRTFTTRIGEHLDGGGAYHAIPKGWADLAPKVAFTIRLPRWKWLRLAVEQLMIWVLCPVYNVKGQAPWNLRRKSTKSAKAERWRRDNLGLLYKWILTLAHWAGWVLAGWMAWMIWGWVR